MKAIVLGSAAGGGYPQWNCRCAVCTLAWKSDPRVRRRTQSSVAVSANGEDWLLLNASPDLGAQIAANPALHPRPSGSPLAAVVLTNGDVDHIAGLLTLRERQAPDVIALPPVHEAIWANTVFGALSRPRKVVAALREPVSLPGGLEIELFAVPGKLPLYLEGEAPEIGGEGGETAGVAIRADGRTLLYVPGCAALSPDLADRLAEADVIMFDGTLYEDDEMIRADLGIKTGRRMGHMPIAGPVGSLEALSAFAARRIYVHINNTNPVLIEGSPERCAVEEAGIEIAEDGMEIEI